MLRASSRSKQQQYIVLPWQGCFEKYMQCTLIRSKWSRGEWHWLDPKWVSSPGSRPSFLPLWSEPEYEACYSGERHHGQKEVGWEKEKSLFANQRWERPFTCTSCNIKRIGLGGANGPALYSEQHPAGRGAETPSFHKLTTWKWIEEPIPHPQSVNSPFPQTDSYICPFKCQNRWELNICFTFRGIGDGFGFPV